jgi:hypothetical protein
MAFSGQSSFLFSRKRCLSELGHMVSIDRVPLETARSLFTKMGGLQPVSFSGIYRNTLFMRFTSTLLRTVVLVAVGTLARASQPVTVTMQDGSQIKGSFAGGSADEIKVVVAGQTLTLKTANIEAVRFDSGPAMNPTQAFTPISPVPATPAARQAGTTIPANTPVIVRLIDPADSSHDSVGKEYRASLDEPLVNQSGVVVAPRGSDVLIVLANRQESGHFAGKTELRLALRSLTIQGKRYDASSTDVLEASSSRTARSEKTIGGLAAAGAVIGAIAGGGKGAAIGAGSGATLGTLGQVFTSGQRVRVPSETRLTFRLQQPLQVN